MTRILVVDDELTLVELVRGYLEREQYEVLTAKDGQTETGRMRRLVDDLQELSRAEAHQIPLTLQPIALQQLVQNALEPLEGQFVEKGLALQIQLPEHRPPVLADPVRTVQILTNLLINALRYTPAPGRVEVSVSREEG